MKDKNPAFLLYASDFLSDENVRMMSNREVGCYIKLICYCWQEGSIPSEVTRIAKLCDEDSSAMAQLWLAISCCFVAHPELPDRLVHPRLQTEREKLAARKKERAESGARGAKSRWNKEKQATSSAMAQSSLSDSSANGSAINQPLAKNGISIPIDNINNLPKGKTVSGETAPFMSQVSPAQSKELSVWDVLLPIMTRDLSVDDKKGIQKARAAIGQAVKEFGQERALEMAVRLAAKPPAGDPVQYLMAAVRNNKQRQVDNPTGVAF